VSPRKNQRPTNVAYYWRNREWEINRVRVRQAGAVEMLRELRRVPCGDCGGGFEPHQMDFDHRDPTTKSFALMTGRAMLMSDEKLLAEVAKCDVVCANCHHLRTRRLWDGQPRKGKFSSPSQARRLKEWRAQADLLAQLRDVACADCGQKYLAVVMEFDHRDPSENRWTVSRMIGRATNAEIEAEATKCDIVCANCHRMRTYRRRESAGERE
jgi:hypothetical protein